MSKVSYIGSFVDTEGPVLHPSHPSLWIFLKPTGRIGSSFLSLLYTLLKIFGGIIECLP